MARRPHVVCVACCLLLLLLPPPAFLQDERHLPFPLSAQPLLRAAAQLLQAPAVHLLHLDHLEQVQEPSGQEQQAPGQAEPWPAPSQ